MTEKRESRLPLCPLSFSITQPLNANDFSAPSRQLTQTLHTHLHTTPPPFDRPSPWTLAHCLQRRIYSFKLNYFLAFCAIGEEAAVGEEAREGGGRAVGLKVFTLWEPRRPWTP